MPALFPAWRLLGALGLSLSTLLMGCASAPPPLPPATLLQDTLFGMPPRPADADAVLAVSPAMRAHLAQVIDSLLFATEERAIEEARRTAQAKRSRYALSQ